jgi:hypothetical protein
MDQEQAARGDLGRDTNYVAERTAWIKAQRLVTELKLAQMKADLAPTWAISASVSSVASAVKQAVFAQAAALAPACVGRKAAEIQATLYEGLRLAFEQFDEEHIERIIKAACEGAEEAVGAGAEGSAAVQRKRLGRRRKKAKPRVKRESGGVAD